jgi:hypothetical protein
MIPTSNRLGLVGTTVTTSIPATDSVSTNTNTITVSKNSTIKSGSQPVFVVDGKEVSSGVVVLLECCYTSVCIHATNKNVT